MKPLMIFGAMLVLDLVFALYTRRVSDGSAIKAGAWATLILVLNGYVVTEYVNDSTLIIPAGVGAFVGTYIAVKLDTKGGQ